MMLRLILALATFATMSCCGTAAADPNTPADTYYCRFTTYQGGHYYVQVYNLTVPGKGMCTAAEVDYTQKDFQNISGLKRRCILDRPEQIKSKAAIVSIYSDETSDSVAAARLICSNTHNDFTE